MQQGSGRFENLCPQTIAMRVMSVTLFYSTLHHWQWLYFTLLYDTDRDFTSCYFTLHYWFLFLKIVPPDKHHACDGSDFGGIVLTAGQGSWQISTRYTHDTHTIHTRQTHDKHMIKTRQRRRESSKKKAIARIHTTSRSEDTHKKDEKTRKEGKDNKEKRTNQPTARIRKN